MVLQEKEIKDILRLEQRNDIFYIENTNQCLFYPEAWTQDNETSAVDQLQSDWYKWSLMFKWTYLKLEYSDWCPISSFLCFVNC